MTINSQRAAAGLPELPRELTTEDVRRLLRECVTVVGPGETLVVQVTGWTPGQVRDLQRFLNSQRPGFRVLVVPGNGLGRAITPGNGRPR